MKYNGYEELVLPLCDLNLLIQILLSKRVEREMRLPSWVPSCDFMLLKTDSGMAWLTVMERMLSSEIGMFSSERSDAVGSLLS